MMIGFNFNVSVEPYTLLFDEKKLVESHGFGELWVRDVLLENLSRRRREIKFDWINPPPP